MLPGGRSKSRIAPLLLALPAAALAQAGDRPWTVELQTGWRHEANTLLLADGQAPPPGLARSDEVWRSSLQLALDQPVGRQRLQARIALVDERLSRNTRFDHQAGSLDAAWQWASAGGWSGTLHAATARRLLRTVSDELGIPAGRNTERSERVDARAQLGGAAQLAAWAEAGTQRVDYSAAEYAGRDLRQQRLAGGLLWRPGGATRLEATIRLSDGRYPNALSAATGATEADRFRRREVEVRAEHDPGGATRIDARLALGRTRHDLAPQRDVSGLAGELGLAWRPTSRLRLQARLAREPGLESAWATGGTTIDARRYGDSLRLAAAWEASAAFGLDAALSAERRDLARVAVVGDAGPLRATDRSHAASLGLHWQPLRGLRLAAESRLDRRHAGSALAAPYRATTHQISVQWTLQP